MRAEILKQRMGFRVLGLDDGPFRRGQPEPVLVVGTVVRGSGQLEGLLSTHVLADDFDATERLATMIRASKFSAQLHYLMLGGITVGGFNVVDLPALAAATGIKLLAVTRRRPDLPAIFAAIEQLPEPARRGELVRRAGPVVPLHGLYCQLHGLGPLEAESLLQLVCINGRFPEPLRLAHLIAGGLVLGQSGRRA